MGAYLKSDGFYSIFVSHNLILWISHANQLYTFEQTKTILIFNAYIQSLYSQFLSFFYVDINLIDYIVCIYVHAYVIYVYECLCVCTLQKRIFAFHEFSHLWI